MTLVETPSDDARQRRLGHALRVAEVLNALVRPFLGILFGSTIVYMAVTGAVTSGEFLGVSAVVLGYLFQSRETEKANARLAEQQGEMLGLAKALPPGTEIHRERST